MSSIADFKAQQAQFNSAWRSIAHDGHQSIAWPSICCMLDGLTAVMVYCDQFMSGHMTRQGASAIVDLGLLVIDGLPESSRSMITAPKMTRLFRLSFNCTCGESHDWADACDAELLSMSIAEELRKSTPPQHARQLSEIRASLHPEGGNIHPLSTWPTDKFTAIDQLGAMSNKITECFFGGVFYKRYRCRWVHGVFGPVGTPPVETKEPCIYDQSTVSANHTRDGTRSLSVPIEWLLDRHMCIVNGLSEKLQSAGLWH